MIVAGCDVGSLTAKAFIMNEKGRLAGVIGAVASKAASLIDGAGAKDRIALIGGLSKIPAIKETLTKLTGKQITTLPIDGQLVAAFGAALIAQGKIIQKKRCLFSKGGAA